MTHLDAARTGSMPRSPILTSTGSPGTSLIARKVRSISAKKVGRVRAMTFEQEFEHRALR